MLRYEKGQLYKPHHDADQDDVALACGPRILTFFLYLSDVDEGERIVRKEILDIPFTLPLTLPLSSFLSSFFTLTRLPHFFPPIHLPPLPLSLPFLLLTYSPFLPSSLSIRFISILSIFYPLSAQTAETADVELLCGTFVPNYLLFRCDV